MYTCSFLVFLAFLTVSIYFIFPETDDVMVLFISHGWLRIYLWTNQDIEILFLSVCKSSRWVGEARQVEWLIKVNIFIWKSFPSNGARNGILAMFGDYVIMAVPIFLGKNLCPPLCYSGSPRRYYCKRNSTSLTFYLLSFLFISLSLLFWCLFSLPWIRKTSVPAWC